MAEAQVKLGYILDPLFQVENTNGKPVVGGHIEVYEAGTNVKYITYQNFDYTQNPFKIPLGSDGRAVVLGDCDLSYDVYIYDSFNNLIVSRLNVAAGDAGGVAGGGLREVIHDETMTGKGTQLSPLGVSPLTNLAVDETMTAYEATVEGKDSLVLGVNGDWFYNQFGSAFSGKVDWSAFNSAYYGLKGDISSKADWSALNNYFTKNETYNNFLPRSAIDLNNYYTKDEVFNKSETNTILGFKEDKLYFGYDENSAISSINNSALAGQGGDGNCPWISGTKVIADTQTLTSNMIIQILSSFDLSGYHNHNIGLKGGTYRFPNEYEIGSALLHTNYFMHLSGMSGYLPISSFSSYTASIANNLENNWLYTNSAYSLSINNLYNKVDWSAFSAYSAQVDPAIINNITNQITNISNASGDWNEISSYQQNSANYLTGINIPESANWNEATTAYQANSGTYLTAHQSLEDYYKKTETSSKGEIADALSNIPQGDPQVNNFVQTNSSTIVDVDNVVTTNSGLWLTAHQTIPSAKWENASDVVQANSAGWGTIVPTGDFALKSDFGFQKVQDAGFQDFLFTVSGKGIGKALSSEKTRDDIDGWPIQTTYLKVSAASALSSTLSGAIDYVSGQINNKLDTTAFTAWSASMASADYELSAGDGIALVDDVQNKITRIDFTGTSGPDLSAGEGIEITTNGGKTIITNNISAGPGISMVYDVETNKIRIDGEGREYTGVAPISVDNVNNQISISGESLSAGPGIDLFESGGYVVISSYGGSTPTTYCYVYPQGYGELDLDTMTAYNKVTVFAPGDYSPDRMLYGTDDNLNHSQKVMPSGLWVEALKNRKEGGEFSWSLVNSGWISYNNMWEGD